MNKFYDSHEAEKLKKLISDKKIYLSKLENKFAYQQTQKEIFLLEDILPIVLSNTIVIHSEFAKYAVKCLDATFSRRVNGLVIYQPLELQFTERPQIGICNSMANIGINQPGAVEIFVDTYEGVEAQCINLNPLIK